MANDDLVWALNLINGQVARIQRHVFEHPAFAGHHVEVEPFTASYDAASWVAKTPAEYEAWSQTVEGWNAHLAPQIQPDEHNTLFGILPEQSV